MYLDPKNDLTFKRIFGDEKRKKILKSFLNSLLKLDGDKKIVDVHILNLNQVPKLKGLKDTMLDVKCRDQRGIEYIVEMQVAKLKGFEKRVLYYTSKAYFSQIKQGQQYPELNQVIFLGILGFSFLESKHYISDHLILDKKTNEHVIKDMQFCFVELPKFKKTEDELETIEDKWIYFLKYAEDIKKVPKKLEEEKEIVEAFEVLEETNWSKEEMELYDKLDIYKQDELGRIEQAMIDGLARGEELGMKKGEELGLKKGKIEGRQEGLAKGLAKGLAEGIEKGKLEEKIEIAKNMLNQGVDKQIIMSVTGLTQIQIKELKR